MVHLFSEMFVLQFSKVEKASTEQVDAALPLPLSTSSTILTKLSPWSLLELLCLDSLDFYVIAKLLIVFPSYEIYALLCAYLRPINLGRLWYLPTLNLNTIVWSFCISFDKLVKQVWRANILLNIFSWGKQGPLSPTVAAFSVLIAAND